jgi:hypothetical protein
MPFDPGKVGPVGPADTDQAFDGLPASPELILISSAREQRRARELLPHRPGGWSQARATGRSRGARPRPAPIRRRQPPRRRRRILVRASFALLVAGLFAMGMAAARYVASSAAAGDPVIAAAGDICGSPTDCAPSARLLDTLNPDAVLLLGDNAYPDGSLSQYQTEYNPNWGRQNAKVFPAPGNHEFHTSNAQGYRDYFGSRAPALWFSFDIGTWHLISLAGDVGVSASAGSPQEQFLKSDLAAHPNTCTLVYFHEPRFSSGTVHGSDSGVSALWNDMYAASVDLVLNGHEHNYERFAKQNPSGIADPNGIREIVAGIGGADEGDYPFGTPIANSQVRGQVDGILKLTLHPGGYDWQVLPVAGQSFTDSGSDACSGAAPSTTSSSTSTRTTTAPTTSTTAPPPTTTTTPPSTSTTTGSSTTTATSTITTTPTTTSTSSTTTTTTTPQSGSWPARWRMAYSNWTEQGQMPYYGFNLIETFSKAEADATPPGTQGQIWLQDYDNKTCSWELSDAEVTSRVTSMANDPKVSGFYFSNEPHPWECPNAYAQHKARSDLIHKLAPTKYTLIGIDGNDRNHFDAQVAGWAGTADYINYNPYVCFGSDKSRCDYAWEDHVIGAAQSLYESTQQRYFVSLQAFRSTDGWWRWPTASEEAQMLDRLKNPALTGLSGYLTFSWNWQNDPLLNHPSVLAEIQAYNLGKPSPCCASPTPTPTTTTPTTSTVPTATTSPGTTSTTTTTADRTPPTAPAHLRVTTGTRTSLILAWDVSFDNVGVAGYRVWRGTTLLGTPLSPLWFDAPLKCPKSYTYAVEAIDLAGNVSPRAVYSAECSFH